MVMVTSGVTPTGEPCEFYLDENLQRNIDEVKKVVGTGTTKGKDWDYVSIIAGTPGTGKSNFAMNLARYCCEWFDLSYVAFTAKQFIDLTTNCKKNSSVVLDESFASMNIRAGVSKDFVRVVNHLQLVRQRNLYIFLCLPNFFDLQKSIAIYRTHHLFVCYSPNFGDRGSFAAFSRDAKKLLYIKGRQFMNYHAEKPNFRGRFVKAKCVDHEAYERLKFENLKEQEDIMIDKNSKARDSYIAWIRENHPELTQQQIADIGFLSRRTIITILGNHQKEGVVNE